MSTSQIDSSTVRIKKERNFDIATDYSDHHFISTNQSWKQKYQLSNENKPVYKKIMTEWKILEKHLPDNIFVRVYEERIDLLRATIIGTSGTPYQNGLFFFDLAFPSNYPNDPPMIHFHSHGLRLNPNLYENGRVCLSLINTWSGRDDERWAPRKSTILQVLVSIQGLVLNEDPYFNEPNVASQRKTPLGEERSVVYKNNIFVYSCYTMIHTMRNPPRSFEGLVKEHFRAFGDNVLECFKAYEDRLTRNGDMPSSSLSCFYVKNKVEMDNERLFDLLKKWFDYVKKDNEVEMEMPDDFKVESNTIKPAKKGVFKRLIKFFRKLSRKG